MSTGQGSSANLTSQNYYGHYMWLQNNILSKFYQTNPNNQTERQELYDKTIEYIKQHKICDLDNVLSNFKRNSEWPNIIINSFMLYTTAWGVASVIIPELIIQGIVTATLLSVTCLTFLLPAAVALPYFICKAKEEINKQKPLQHTEKLVLHAQQALLIKQYKEKYDNGVLEIDNGLTQFLEQDQQTRHFFNSTLLASSYLFGTLFALGITILSIAYLSTPLGWALVTLGSLAATMLYSNYHSKIRLNTIEHHYQLNTMRLTIAQYHHALFHTQPVCNDPDTVHLQEVGLI